MPDLIRLGVAAMDRKARSKPMRNILSRLLATGSFDIIVFGDKVLMDEDIENWPICDFLISFFSSGFPMDKAINYVNLRKPVCVNDLPTQKVFWDRRVVHAVLDAIGVRTPDRVEVNRDGGPKVDPDLAATLEKDFGIKINEPRPFVQPVMQGDSTLKVGDTAIDKSFVEKPVSGEDHNVYIYFSEKRGGGGRRLFRKIGNKSSEYDPELRQPRDEGSFVYEKFMDVENAEDLKIYTLGPNFVHAETRKSPVVDGVVRRNTDGKEIRFICQLTAEERQMASDIARAFKQNICGFDVLRAGGKSYVIDVNGWSFVKGNDYYYDKCAEILAKFCNAQPPSEPRIAPEPPLSAAGTPTVHAKDNKSWRVHSVVTVFRHADRTPKMKLKFAFKGAWSQPFITLLQNRRDEIILRQPAQIQYVYEAANTALQMEDCDEEKLLSLKKILEKKAEVNGTKVQLKPSFDDEGSPEKIQVIVKWGGEYTHAARYQSRDIGENMRKDLTIMNKGILRNVTIYSSSEPRVIASAETFGGSLLDDPKNKHPVQHRLIIRKDLLDDSNAAKEPMDVTKKQLKVLLRPGEHKRPEFCWPVPEEPVWVVAETMKLMRFHRDVLYENWKRLDVEKIQGRWCCGEYPELFRERWEKLFNDFCDVDPSKFDPSRVSELYDSLKYDALHNKTFLETIFRPADEPVPQSEPNTARTVTPKKLRDLYRRAKELFDFIAPQEYGIERIDKEKIGLLTSLPLLSKIIEDLKAAIESGESTGNFYFTKESHIQTLVNLVIFSNLDIVMPQLPELDYLSYITFEIYERLNNAGEKQFSVRISLCEGAHAFPLDVNLDAKHALQVQPRRVLTNYIALPDMINSLSRHTLYAELLKKSTTPYEGMLPIEGDALFAGRTDPSIQFRSFFSNSSRPRSIQSADGVLNGASTPVSAIHSTAPSEAGSTNGDAQEPMAKVPKTSESSPRA